MRFLKAFFKWVFPVSAALLLCMCCILPVFAEESDAAQEEGQKNYKGHVTYTFTHSDGSYSSYDRIEFTFGGDSPFYLVYLHYDDGGIRPYLFCGSLENLDVSNISASNGLIYGSKSYSRSTVLYDTRGVGTISTMWVDHVGFDSASPRYLITADIPVFYSVEALKNYLETGDDSGIVNKDDLKASVSRSLPYLRNVTWHINPNCYGSSPKVVGDEFTWDTSELYPAAKIEVKADVTIHFGKTDGFLNIITGTGHVQLDIKNTVNVISYDGSTGLSSPSYDSGYLLIPDDKLRQAVAFYVDNNTDFASSAVQSVSVTSFYLRMVFYDETERVLHVGGWTRVNVQNYADGGDFVSTGDFDPDTGDYVQDTTSDGSYSYGTNIDGSYDFDNTLGTPKNIGEAFEMFLQIMKLLFTYMGKVPELVKRVYGFLPSIFNWMIGALLFVAFILRILGR